MATERINRRVQPSLDKAALQPQGLQSDLRRNEADVTAPAHSARWLFECVVAVAEHGQSDFGAHKGDAGGCEAARRQDRWLSWNEDPQSCPEGPQ